MKPRKERRQSDRLPQDPSPEEIERRCQALRHKWSEQVFRKRAGLNPPPLTVTVAPSWFEFADYRKPV